MPEATPIYVVDIEPDEALALRAGPLPTAAVLAALEPGQLVARLDEDDRGGWWHVFADTPGEGAFVGYVLARDLRSWTDAPPVPLSPPPNPGSGTTDGWPNPPGKASAPGWNALLPETQRHRSEKRSVRSSRTVNRVIIHIAGKEKFEDAHRVFMDATAPHYLIDKAGALHQYCEEKDRAWHAGIEAWEREIYDRNDGSWRRYRRIVPGVNLPSDSVYLAADGRTRVSRDSPQAKMAMRPDGSNWPTYAAFDERWGPLALPIGYADIKDPNAKSIGIELLSYGHREPLAEHYPEAMYRTLASLVADICARYGLPRVKGVVVGHEDVNPIARGMWDPNSGFDWSRIRTDVSRSVGT